VGVNSSGTTQLKLLIVDDDQLTRNTLQSLIAVKYPALRINSADNGCTGLASFRDQRQNIVITDLCMPHMDGDQMAKEIFSMDAQTVVIAITAYSDEHRLAKARAAGITHILNKPLEFKKLFAVIDTYL